jgi:hypothetical protein
VRRFGQDEALPQFTTRKAGGVNMAETRAKPDLPHHVVEELRTLATRLKGQTVSRIAWDTLLTAADRKATSLETFRKEHIVDRWQELRGVSQARAILDLSYELEMLSDVRYRRLLAVIGELAHNVPAGDKPSWDRNRCVLKFRGQVVRRTRKPHIATRIVSILDAFEEEGWPDRIDSPLRGGVDSQLLRESVASLNERLKLIRFESDGSGQGITWCTVK